MKEYYIGSGDYFGKNGPNDYFNKTFVPYLKRIGLSDKQINEVSKMTVEIYDIGYSNGYDNAVCED